MAKHKFAICIDNDDMASLTLGMIYRVIPDKTAEPENFIRVIDNEGEDYLYPEDYFILFDFPPALEKALLRITKHSR